MALLRIDDAQHLQLLRHHSMVDDCAAVYRGNLAAIDASYKNTGHFIPGSSCILMTDSLGIAAIYDHPIRIEHAE
jgi:hypothetical protein